MTLIQCFIPVPLAVVIIGRDVLLSISAFYIRYTSLPEPVCIRTTVSELNYCCNAHATAQKTFTRYWDFSVPSAEVRPTGISKVRCMYAALYAVLTAHKVNTALQLLLMGTTTISPLLPLDIGLGLQALQCVHNSICGVLSADISQVDRRCHDSVEWSFLSVHQRCRPHPLQTAPESKSTQPAATILTSS